MWKFGRKRAKAPIAIATLPVPMSAWVDDGPYALPQALVDIVNQLTGPGEYLRDELPVEAFWSYHTDYYLAQVNNGGHGQFARNSGWSDAVNADIRNGLRAMLLSNAEEIFSEFERFARDEPTRFTVAREGGGFGDIDPVIADLDARFFQIVSKAIPPAHTEWLRTLQVLAPVSDAELPARMNELITANLLRAKRHAERERLVAAAQARDPLVQAFKLMLAHAEPPLAYRGWTSGMPVDDSNGMMFFLDTDQGSARAVFLADRAALFAPGAEKPCLMLAMTELDAAVHQITGTTLSAGLNR